MDLFTIQTVTADTLKLFLLNNYLKGEEDIKLFYYFLYFLESSYL